MIYIDLANCTWSNGSFFSTEYVMGVFRAYTGIRACVQESFMLPSLWTMPILGVSIGILGGAAQR